MTKWDVHFNGWESANEAETFVHPSQGITFLEDEDSAFALYAKGLYEVSVLDNKSRAVALTLFRSYTSEVAVSNGEKGQMMRKMEFEYCLHFISKLK